eukprot:TRINITY_DN7226_c0_g1_i1.p1 TRINITY_DN7226_c0_g1~~TRINITY_DN7226_c0_g1_i1.p1  ORF type:complete len:399 (-),score=166.20 TRINITY_DN7226_c0_g1_i1:212-1408(-)
MSEKENLNNEKGQQYGADFSFWTALKSIISKLSWGTDITKISLPSCLCIPYSLLEVIAQKRMTGMSLIRDIEGIEDPLGRMLTVIRWYLPALIRDEYAKKPLNPILGEYYECVAENDPNLHYVAEQIKHHPPTTAFNFTDALSGSNYEGSVEVTTEYKGNTLAAHWIGKGCLNIGGSDDEKYVWDQHYPTLNCTGFILGRKTMAYEGRVKIHCAKNKLLAILSFKSQKNKNKDSPFPWIHAVEGEIINPDNKTLATIKGICEEKVTYKFSKKTTPVDLPYTQDDVLLDWSIVDVRPKLREIIPEDEEILAKTSTEIWKEVAEALRAFNLDLADETKAVVENREREKRLLREENNEELPPPRMFDLIDDPEAKVKYLIKSEFKEQIIATCQAQNNNNNN